MKMSVIESKYYNMNIKLLVINLAIFFMVTICPIESAYIRQSPSAQYSPSKLDRVISLPLPGDLHMTDVIKRHNRSPPARSEWESRLRSFLVSKNFNEDQVSTALQKALDVLFKDIERKSRPRYG